MFPGLEWCGACCLTFPLQDSLPACAANVHASPCRLLLQEERAKAAAAALEAATTPEAKAAAEAAAKQAEEEAAAALKAIEEEDAKVGRTGVGKVFSKGGAGMEDSRQNLTVSDTSKLDWPRRAVQVDYVADVLRSYSIIQENQWNKGEM